METQEMTDDVGGRSSVVAWYNDLTTGM
jgi:hypothetical protein